jgi:hypothetical protein
LAAFIKGSVPDGDPRRFIANVYFSAVARRQADHWRGLVAKLSVAWKN